MPERHGPTKRNGGLRERLITSLTYYAWHGRQMPLSQKRSNDILLVKGNFIHFGMTKISYIAWLVYSWFLSFPIYQRHDILKIFHLGKSSHHWICSQGKNPCFILLTDASQQLHNILIFRLKCLLTTLLLWTRCLFDLLHSPDIFSSLPFLCYQRAEQSLRICLQKTTLTDLPRPPLSYRIMNGGARKL